MESAALRASHRLGPGQKGVLIRNVAPTSPAAGVLAAGDIVMRFDGMQVACDGTVPFRCGPTLLRTTALSHALGPRLSAGAAARRTGERISFHYLISQKYTGDQAGCPTLNGEARPGGRAGAAGRAAGRAHAGAGRAARVAGRAGAAAPGRPGPLVPDHRRCGRAARAPPAASLAPRFRHCH